MTFLIETERLSLRALEARDLPALVALLGDADVMRLALYERALTPAEAQAFIDEAFARDAVAVDRLAILCRRSSGAILGFAGLLPCKYFEGELELGFVLTAEAQGKGYATEIGRKLLEIAFGSLGRRRIYALCDPRNFASHKLLERNLGMRHVNEIQTADRGPRLVFEIAHGAPHRG